MRDSMATMHSTATERLPRQETFSRTFLRRLVTVPAFFIAAILALLLAPLLYPIALIVDLVGRRNLATVRAIAMVHAYLGCETVGIAASAWIWIRHRRNRERFLEQNFRLQCWWATALYRAGERIFALKVVVQGDELVTSGPMIVFARHVSPIDNLLPAVLISGAHDLRLRWVINRSLLRDPCLDIVGNRLPNCFVAAASGDSEAEIRRVEALGRGLGERDGVLIFPEGALFSPERRERVIRRLGASGESDLLERARRLQNVLPPRLGGSLALLDAARGIDAVFLAHTGLEDSTAYRSILGGGLIGRTVHIRMRRVPASEIPSGRDGRIDWLYENWEELDRWVTANSAQPTLEVKRA
ncbi:MAG: 1-acyl-sn-glycerol-3-phosphate acyltransferase [Tepidiformaceae bacterium]